MDAGRCAAGGPARTLERMQQLDEPDCKSSNCGAGVDALVQNDNPWKYRTLPLPTGEEVPLFLSL